MTAFFELGCISCCFRSPIGKSLSLVGTEHVWDVLAVLLLAPFLLPFVTAVFIDYYRHDFDKLTMFAVSQFWSTSVTFG